MPPEQACPFPIGDDDGTAKDCIAKGHCSCDEEAMVKASSDTPLERLPGLREALVECEIAYIDGHSFDSLISRLKARIARLEMESPPSEIAPIRPNIPRVTGVGRDAGHECFMSVSFERPLTDNEMRDFHDWLAGRAHMLAANEPERPRSATASIAWEAISKEEARRLVKEEGAFQISETPIFVRGRKMGREWFKLRAPELPEAAPCSLCGRVQDRPCWHVDCPRLNAVDRTASR